MMQNKSTALKPVYKSRKRHSNSRTGIDDHLTEEWLRQNATEKVCKRAQDYSHENVIEVLHWSETEVIAEMYGSQPYTTSLCLKQAKIVANCTCPARHDWPGLCKHIVGLGLFVIEHKGVKKDFPRLKEQIRKALAGLTVDQMQTLCLDLAMLNRHFRDRILAELDINFEPKLDWDNDF